MKFWMLYVEGGGAPAFKHDTEVQARREAVRLAQVNSGKKVYLLEATAAVAVVGIQWEVLDDLPF